MDVIDLLVADHNRVRGLFTRYQAADEADNTEEASALAGEIIKELKIHMAAEEAVFYRAVKERTEEIHEEVDEGAEEHHVARVLIGEIENVAPGSDSWVAKMTVLIESVEHHVDEEEEELFPSVRSATPASWREELGTRLEVEKGYLGAPALADKMERTKAELHTMARQQEIPGRSKMGHDELAATVGVDQT
jgi:hemerythrin superfamily protein